MSDKNKDDIVYPENMNWWNKKALEFGRDINYAPVPGLGWLMNLIADNQEADTGYIRPDKNVEYRGQNIEPIHTGGEAKLDAMNRFYGVKRAPDLLGIYTGYTTPEDQGLTLSEIKPSGGYPWSDNTAIYDATPYINFGGFTGSAQAMLTLQSKIDDMSPGDIISHKDLERLNIGVDHHASIDLGRTNWSIGKDDENKPYIAMADTWDFKNMSGWNYGVGYLMDKLGKGENVKDIGFYGRFDINPWNYGVEE